jgi:hypothetical protein
MPFSLMPTLTRSEIEHIHERSLDLLERVWIDYQTPRPIAGDISAFQFLLASNPGFGRRARTAASCKIGAYWVSFLFACASFPSNRVPYSCREASIRGVPRLG